MGEPIGYPSAYLMGPATHSLGRDPARAESQPEPSRDCRASRAEPSAAEPAEPSRAQPSRPIPTEPAEPSATADAERPSRAAERVGSRAEPTAECNTMLQCRV